MAPEMTEQQRVLLTRLQLKDDVESFYTNEIDLLDERRYDEWLDLLTDDMRYWVPMRRNVKFGEWEREFTREGQDLNWFDEGKVTLTMRVRQIQTGIHWAEEPSSRVCHLISNVQVVQASPSVDAPSEVTATSRFLIYRNRVATETDILAGKREDHLRRVGDGWQIARRKVVLDQSVVLAKSLTFFF